MLLIGLADESTPGEVKHLSSQRKRNRIDPVSSGERKRGSLNLFSIILIVEDEGNRVDTFKNSGN